MTDLSSNLLSDVFQSSPAGIYALEAIRDQTTHALLDFRIILVNRAFCQSEAKPEADLVGHSLLTRFPTVRQTGWFDCYQRVVETGEPYRSQTGYPHTEGSSGYEVSIVRSGDGVVVNFLPVTTQEPAAPIPNEATVRLRQIFDNITMAVSLLRPLYNADGQVTDLQFEFVNPPAANLRGLLPADMVGQTYSALFVEATANGGIGFISQILAAGQPVSFELEYNADGLSGWFDQIILPVDGNLLFMTTDITNRKRLEQAQQAQTELLQTVVDNTQAGLLLAEAVRQPDATGRPGPIVDFRCQLTNAFNARLGGKTVADITGKLLGDVFGGWQNSDLFGRMIAVVASGEAQKAVFPYTSFGWDGWFDGSFIKVGDGILYTYTDVSELKKAEETTRRQADTFDAVLAATLHGMNVLRVIPDEAGQIMDLRYEYVSDQVLRDTGLTRDQLIGQTTLSLFPGVRTSRFWRAYQDAMRTGQPQQFEEYYSYDGYANHLTCQVIRIDEHRLVAMYQSVNELKQAQQTAEQQAALLRSVLDGSQNGIIAFDSVRNEQGTIVDFRYLLQNEANRQRVGRTDEQILGKTMLTFFPDVATNGLLERYSAVVDTGEPFRQDLAYDYGQGPGWYNLSVVKRGDGIVLTVQDKTAEKLTEESLLANQQQLEAANLALSRSNEYLQQFAYVASHDLQEPLRKIQAFSDMLLTQHAQGLDKSGQDLLERQQQAASRMQTLVKDLLDYARLTSQQIPLQPVSLQRLTEGVLGDLETTIRETKAVVTVGDLPTVPGDATQLGQLIQNLLSNALKFTQPGQQPEVHITARQLTADQLPQAVPNTNRRKWVALQVADKGIGFEQGYSDRIFEIFHRLHNRSQYVGTGIGLAVVKKVVDNHGGLITVTSQPGVGTTFTVYLPMSRY